VSDVRLAGVSVSYDGVRVVHELSIDVPSGEWLALIGPNGAGKTTVLRAIARLAHFEGVISIDDQNVLSMGARDVARRVALLLQEPQMPDSMSVSQYVLLGRSPHLGYLGKEGARDRRIVADVLARLALDEFAARPLGHLSGGERQRAAIARALAQQAPVLLIDEPTTSLDVGRQQQVLEIVDELRASEGLTVLSAMHDLTLAGQYADRLLLLDRGRLVASGAAEDVLTRALIAEHYRADVRVVGEPGSGLVVVPVRGSRAS